MFILELDGMGKSLNFAKEASSIGNPSGPETPLAIKGIFPAQEAKDIKTIIREKVIKILFILLVIFILHIILFNYFGTSTG